MNRQATIQTIAKLTITPISDNLLQRACACGQHSGGGGECEDCRKKHEGMLQCKGQNKSPVNHVPAIVYEALRSPGRPLDAQTRARMGLQFGYDFSKVRIHTDAKGTESARAVNALAYTVGRDIVFDSDRYMPQTNHGKRLIAHELTHIVQQRQLPDIAGENISIGPPNDMFEHQADQVASSINEARTVSLIDTVGTPRVQRDLARPPRGLPAPRRQLTADEIASAIVFNQRRFSDPYSIRVIRDVLGLAPVPALVDEEFVQAVVMWQAERHMTQDGKIGHLTTRSLYLELVAEHQLRDAVLILMDSYQLPGDLRLNNISVGTGDRCCGADGGADAVTAGGPQCGGGPINICFCRTRIPRTPAEYDHFVRITGHELIHVPQCAAGTGNVDVDEFEAFFFEACRRGRMPQLNTTQRVNHANTALGHFAAIPPALQTPARIAMRNQLNALIAAGGIGPC